MQYFLHTSVTDNSLLSLHSLITGLVSALTLRTVTNYISNTQMTSLIPFTTIWLYPILLMKITNYVLHTNVAVNPLFNEFYYVQFCIRNLIIKKNAITVLCTEWRCHETQMGHAKLRIATCLMIICLLFLYPTFHCFPF